jgi:glycosyltransferase involved in cell wall biosynthesis
MLNSNQLKKILFVGPYPPPYAGPENAMKTLLESPLRESFDIIFLKTNVRKRNDQKGKFDLILITAFFSFLYRLIRCHAVHRPRIVYHFLTANKIGWFGRDLWCILISKLFRAKIIVHMRAGHFSYSFMRFNNFEKKIIKAICSQVSFGFVQANCLKNQFQGILPKEKIVPVYNAINLNKYNNDNIESYDKNIILFLGHLSNTKGYCDILKIIPKIAEKHPNIKFYFAGEMIRKIKKKRNVIVNQITNQPIKFEDPEDCYKRNILDRYDHNYKYLGVLDDKEKIEILKICNFLLLPTYSEGFSMAVLEALAMGKPVICTPVGALAEIIRNGVNGLTFLPGDHQGITDAINLFLTNSSIRNRIATNNFDYARKLFSHDVISKQITQQFKKAIEDK